MIDVQLVFLEAKGKNVCEYFRLLFRDTEPYQEGEYRLKAW